MTAKPAKMDKNDGPAEEMAGQGGHDDNQAAMTMRREGYSRSISAQPKRAG